MRPSVQTNLFCSELCTCCSQNACLMGILRIPERKRLNSRKTTFPNPSAHQVIIYYCSPLFPFSSVSPDCVTKANSVKHISFYIELYVACILPGAWSYVPYLIYSIQSYIDPETRNPRLPIHRRVLPCHMGRSP